MAAAMVLGFASCSSDGDLTPTVDTLKDTPMQIKASVAGMKTRAGYDANSVPDRFYLKIKQGLEDHKQKYWYDVIMKLENGEWVAYDVKDETKKVQLLRAGYFITCYLYPSTIKYDVNDNGEQANSVEVEVLSNQSTEANIKASDHLYAQNQDDNKTVKDIELKMEHQMSKLSLELTLGTEYVEEQNPITDMQIVGTKRKVSWSGGYVDEVWGVSAENITPFCVSYTKPTADTKKAKALYEVILAPQTIETGNFGVEFKISDKSYRWYSDAAVKLEKGTQYTLQLTAGKDQVNPVEITSKAWNTTHKNDKNEEVDNKSDIETF